MQPVQLSLIPDPHPAPPATPAGDLPEEAITEAITLLARVIAHAAVGVGIEGSGDE